MIGQNTINIPDIFTCVRIFHSLTVIFTVFFWLHRGKDSQSLTRSMSLSIAFWEV